jgi:hypothetical protein
MAGYTFDEQGVRRIQEMARRVLRTPITGSQRRRQVPLMVGGGGGMDIVRFVIQSVSCDVCEATALVISWPSGRKPSSEDDGYEYDQTTITVRDLGGCWLNAPSLDLIGTVGYAVKLYHGADYDRCAIGSGEFWEILSLCCSQFEDINPPD